MRMRINAEKDDKGIPRKIKIVDWNKDEIAIELTAYEFAEDEWDESRKGKCDCIRYPPSDIYKALRDFIDRVDKKYELVDLGFYSQSLSYYQPASFALRFSKNGVKMNTSVDISSETDEATKRLSQIMQFMKETIKSSDE